MSELHDPRVFFAAERTLLAWNRTALALMAFGFMIERFGLFMRELTQQFAGPIQRGLSFWIGLAFIGLGIMVCVSSIAQYRQVLRNLDAVQIPRGHTPNLGVWVNGVVILLGILLMAYLLHGVAL